MKSKIIKFISYLGLFIVLICIYGYMWVLIKVYFYKNLYSIEILNKDLFLSTGMALISTIGFYLKIKMAKKKNNKTIIS